MGNDLCAYNKGQTNSIIVVGSNALRACRIEKIFAMQVYEGCFGLLKSSLKRVFANGSKRHPKGGATLAPKVQDNSINNSLLFHL